MASVSDAKDQGSRSNSIGVTSAIMHEEYSRRCYVCYDMCTVIRCDPSQNVAPAFLLCPCQCGSHQGSSQ
jgi:hypothetical protein